MAAAGRCLPNGLAVPAAEDVRREARSGYLGYYALVPHAGRGYMRAGLAAVIRRAFGTDGLHRLEANIQPDNSRSIALVRRLGFEKEGYSPRYLKIGGRWRDHERWALTLEVWRATRTRLTPVAAVRDGWSAEPHAWGDR